MTDLDKLINILNSTELDTQCLIDLKFSLKENFSQIKDYNHILLTLEKLLTDSKKYNTTAVRHLLQQISNKVCVDLAHYRKNKQNNNSSEDLSEIKMLLMTLLAKEQSSTLEDSRILEEINKLKQGLEKNQLSNTSILHDRDQDLGVEYIDPLHGQDVDNIKSNVDIKTEKTGSIKDKLKRLKDLKGD